MRGVVLLFLRKRKHQFLKSFVLRLVTVYMAVTLAKQFVLRIEGKHNLHQRAFHPDPELAKPLLQPILRLSNRQFKERFGNVAGSWRGKNPIQRNAVIGLAHFKEESSVPELIDMLLNDQRPMMRGTIAWALGEIGTDNSYEGIRQALEKEEDPSVLAELKKQLTKKYLKIHKVKEVLKWQYMSHYLNQLSLRIRETLLELVPGPEPSFI